MGKIPNYFFPKEKSAEIFMERVNKETSGCASHPFSGNHAHQDTRFVIVKGVGSNIYDLKLRDTCDKLCNELDGVRMPS